MGINKIADSKDMATFISDYGKPEWVLDGNQQHDWLELKRQAIDALARKGFPEVERHAQVSIQNKHRCESCYCCACWAILSEIKHAVNNHICE